MDVDSQKYVEHLPGVMMEPEDFLPTSNNWFAPSLEYIGRCRAYFASPAGSFEGPGKAQVDEAGDVTVEMIPEQDSLKTDAPFGLSLLRFLDGNDLVTDHGRVQTINMFTQNPCTKLEVETPSGIFISDDIKDYGQNSVMNTGKVSEVTFSVGKSTFEASETEEPAYWVLPLANFLSELQEWLPELNRHPLRIFPTPEVPDEITHLPLDQENREDLERRAWMCLYAANSKNRLSVFRFGEERGFIEHLPKYEELEETLLDGRQKHKTTSVMVGPSGDESVGSFEEMRSWFSFDVLSLLTLATGTEIGCPWVEIRDSKGQLVRRFHAYLNVKSFRSGYGLIEEIYSGKFKATGRLVECALSRSKDFGQSYLRIAIVHLVRARYKDLTLDDQISHLARGFETLCKRYKTMGENLSRSLNPSVREEVSSILKAAKEQIQALRSTGLVGPSQRHTINRIAQRVSDADKKDNTFGTAVVKLTKAYWLPDAHILETYYQDRNGSWIGLLGMYRGDVTHHGYLPILENNRDVEELVALWAHLHDLLARMIFKILEFDGKYSPGTVTHKTGLQVDWVKPHTKAQELGYR